MLTYFGCEHGVHTFTVFDVFNLIASKNILKNNDFQINQTYQKHAVTAEDKILIKHYRLDKNIEPENLPPNNPDLNPADYSILENLLQSLDKH